MRVARRENLHEELALSVGHVSKTTVRRDAVSIRLHQAIEFGHVRLVHPGTHRFGDVLIARHIPGDVVLHVRTVGDVVVKHEIGHPRVIEPQPRAHFPAYRP